MKNHRLNRRHNTFILLLLVSSFLFSCTNKAIYDRYQAIENISWEKEKEYYFTFQIDDTTAPYDIFLEVRNNNLYPYQNLWLFYQEELPIGPVVRDTIECMLADEYGKWHGSGISLYQSTFPIRENYIFPHTGQYTFSFRQGMRNDSLRGIQEIGLRIVRAN